MIGTRKGTSHQSTAHPTNDMQQNFWLSVSASCTVHQTITQPRKNPNGAGMKIEFGKLTWWMRMYDLWRTEKSPRRMWRWKVDGDGDGICTPRKCDLQQEGFWRRSKLVGKRRWACFLCHGLIVGFEVRFLLVCWFVVLHVLRVVFCGTEFSGCLFEKQLQLKSTQ